jgi:hypothetical protein
MNFAAHEPRLAGAAIAAFAAVRQIKLQMRCCIEQRLVSRCLKVSAGVE